MVSSPSAAAARAKGGVAQYKPVPPMVRRKARRVGGLTYFDISRSPSRNNSDLQTELTEFTK